MVKGAIQVSEMKTAKRGRKHGSKRARPTKEKILELLKEGMFSRDIERELKCGSQYITEIRRKHRIPLPKGTYGPKKIGTWAEAMDDIEEGRG